MHRTIIASLFLALVCGMASGCKKTAATVASKPPETIQIWNEVAAILANVKDKESLADAKPKLLSLAERIKKLGEERQQLEALAKEDPSVQLPVPSEAHKKLLQETIMKYQGERQRVATDVQGGESMLKEFDKACLPAPPEPTPEKK